VLDVRCGGVSTSGESARIAKTRVGGSCVLVECVALFQITAGVDCTLLWTLFVSRSLGLRLLFRPQPFRLCADKQAVRWLRMASAEHIQALNDAANRMRISAIEMTCASNSGHPTSSCSAAEIMATLFFDEMRYDKDDPKNASADRFVLSKGHACPILYAAWEEAGHLTHEQVLSLRKITSDLEGHPTPRLDFIDVATGSLGQGLSCAAGMAYVGKYIDKASYRVYCLLGDGESAEGSVWEAAGFSSYYKLDNLVAIVDVNRLGQSQQTMLGHDTAAYAKRFEAFGFNAVVVDGNDVSQLLGAFKNARETKGKPTAIIAKTLKGKGIENIEDKDNWHGKPVPIETVKAIEACIKDRAGKGKLPIKKPTSGAPAVDLRVGSIKIEPPSYKKGEKVATRAAYGTALAKLGDVCPRIIGLDGDTKNSTYSEKLLKKHPEQFIECFIAEQNLVGVAIGAACRGRTIPFTSTFAAFFMRATDHLRMGAVSFANIKCAGSHVGVSIGEDGPSQMALEDLAVFRAIPSSTVFYPSDGVATERATELAANTPGIVFIRTGRPANPIIYDNNEHFEVGKGKVVRESADDKILLIGAGVTLFECLKAADTLAGEGMHACVIDPFTIKPLDKELIIKHAKRVGGKVLTVEDHYPAGGIGEAVCRSVADEPGVRVRSLCVTGVPRSGPPDDLLDMFGISAKKIVAAVHEFH
uniref:Transketolase n=1 Tax=Parascaris univalens TaxID=6257 RepID=A0A915ARN3_PARUN